jgi:hypothetical protein
VSVLALPRNSEFGRGKAVARVLCGDVYDVNPPMSPLLIFLEHVNMLSHRRSLVF